MIDVERLRKMFFLFGLILPKPDDMTNEGFKAIFGDELKDILPLVFKQICDSMEKNLEASESYLDFVSQAISYIKQETDDYPDIDGKSQDDLRIILQNR